MMETQKPTSLKKKFSRKDKSWSIKQMLILSFFAISFFVASIGFLSLWQMKTIVEPLEVSIPQSIVDLEESSHLDGLAQIIKYYDEVLTMSARNYAFTGKDIWKDRYMTIVPALDKVIKEAIEKGDAIDQEFFSNVDAANLALVAMEENALNQVDLGYPEQAVQILESDTYWKQKNIYQQGLINYAERRGINYDQAKRLSAKTLQEVTLQTQETLRWNKNFMIIFTIISIFFSLGLGILVSRRIIKPLSDLSKSNQLIIDGKFSEVQQIPQKIYRFLPEELNELLESRKNALAALAAKQNIEDMNKELQKTTKELEKKSKFDEQKRIATLSILEDVAEQKDNIEQASKQLAIESLYPKMNPGSAIRLDESGIILSANPSSEKIFGKAEGKSFFNLIGIDAGLILKVLKKDKLYQTEFLHMDKTYQFTFRWDKEARLIYAYGTDITALKDAEVKIRDAYFQLQELDKLKDLFLSMTSHELKTPITPIKLQAQTMLSGAYGSMNKQMKEGVEVILRNIDHLNSLLSDVLDSAKLEAKNLKLFPERVSLKNLILSAVKDLKQQANQKNISLFSKVKEIPKVTADPKRVTQVLYNLINNSMKFTKPGGNITIYAEKKKNFIIVKVSDTGMGIPKNMLTKIFDKFSQVVPSYTRKEKGTGLGLTISKGIVEQHGGKIWAESKGLGKGASIIFSLPVKNRKLI